jgi:hypothetical protein
MKAVRYMDDELVMKKGVELLINGLGPLETLRFLSFPREKRIETIKRHRDWQKNLDQKQFFDDLFEA